ncbi:hypothetical protein MLD38_030039 [Melastoma candidum]|uniref:Uncharacterized protein n=1 Tax=Melastoma candidum TaxID=119954 RepID=A0ACB9MQQ2_9MYRT|nr:hypothetical protein MLD38_030039 [Melastoma candidum]
MEPDDCSVPVVAGGEIFERKVLEALKLCEGRNEAPLSTAVGISRLLSDEVEFPSAELGEAMVSHLSADFGRPFVWKVLHHAIACRLVSSLHVLCLLAPRVVPRRWSHPEAYRLFLDLVSRYALVFERDAPESAKDRIVRSVGAKLHLCQSYGVHVPKLGHLLVLFFFEITLTVVDCCVNDWGLSAVSGDRSSSVFGSSGPDKMDMEKKGSNLDDRGSQQVLMRKANSLVAIELLEELTKSRKALILLRLIHLNMPEKFNGLMQRILFLKSSDIIPEDIMGSKIVLSRLSVNFQKIFVPGCQISSRNFFGRLNSGRSMVAPSCSYSGSVISSCWAPFDIYMENIMDGRQLPTTSTIDKLSETIIALKVLNQASWKEAFLALWVSALRLVQRERNPIEGPIPHLHSRLCILLCIIPLTIANIFKVEKSPGQTYHDISTSPPKDPVDRIDSRTDSSLQNELINSLQDLDQFSGLLCPPELVIGAANDAAFKAAVLISKSQNTNNSMDGGYCVVVAVKSGGNLRHLIVEACIARNLIDKRVYFWPGYLPASVVTISDASAKQTSPWSSFMEGGPLTPSLVNSLILTPATSYEEVEKVYNFTLNGKSDEKSAAAKILCGASLREGWYIQEHVVNFVVKLLSPPIPLSDTGSEAPVIDYMPVVSVVLFGASSIDTVHVLSLHGVVPEVAAALLPLCETLGSLDPSSVSKTSDEFSIYMVFSAAFLFLLRLWKFYKPPIEVGGIGCDLPLEYLLLLHNSRVKTGLNGSTTQNKVNPNLSEVDSGLDKGLLIDHYPNLRAWYCQNINFVAGSLSGHCNDHHVYQVGDKILDMMYRKMAKTSSLSGDSSLSNSGVDVSPASTMEEAYERPLLPAWDVLEALPFVVEAILTACAYGRISSRDLITGLMDLVDYLPATLATIITYFSAEVTRGVWKPVPMNGMDWPSPSQVLESVESEVRETVAAAGVNVPCCPFDDTPTLPLPMAALVSLTITFKLEKRTEYIHTVAGPAMEDCASACPRSSMPIIGSLWAQKVPRWHDFIIVCCSRSMFRKDKEAITQLLRCCFTSFLGKHGFTNCSMMNPSGINKLLGNSISKMGKLPCIAPGFLYLRSCRTIEDKLYLVDVVMGLVLEYAQKSASRCGITTFTRLKSSRTSLSLVIAVAKEAALLGSCLLNAAGGLLLIQVLYTETIPTWLLSRKEEANRELNTLGRVVEGCAMAYLVVYSVSLSCGVRDQAAFWSFNRRARMNESHMHFLASMLERNLLVGCDPVTWKAYLTCLVSLAATFTPGWISEVSEETLKKLASGLQGWDELDLALSLLERGGVAAMGAVAELLSLIR